MVVKFDHAIGGLINLLYNPIGKISIYVFHVVFTYRANIVDTSFTHLHVIHVSHYMYTCTWYKSVTYVTSVLVYNLYILPSVVMY